jgi:hypothetical protein
MEVLQLLRARRYCPANIPQLNCKSKWVLCEMSCLQSISSAWTSQKTQPPYCCGGMFTAPLHINGRGADHIENTVLLLSCARKLRALPSNGRCLQSHCLATGLYATVYNGPFLWRAPLSLPIITNARNYNLFTLTDLMLVTIWGRHMKLRLL